MSTNILVNGRVFFWQRAGLVGLIAAFVATAMLRLNDCDLFNPDSPRYVIYSQAIANQGEYRAIDLPGSPLYSWRPPGLSLLLAPVMAVSPYDVRAAKIAITLCAVVLLGVLFQFAKLHSVDWAALLITAVVATSPMFLVLSTEVLSEIPYTLGVLIVLYLLSRSTDPDRDQFNDQGSRSRFWKLAVPVAALTFTPWLRTAGVALVIAVSVWSIASRSRREWIIAVIIAMAGMGLLTWRNKLAAGENYVGSMFSRLREQGLQAFIQSGFETVEHYVSNAPGLLLPGLTPQRPSYAPLTLDALPNLGLPHEITSILAAAVAILALLGMWRQRSRGGSLVFLYLAVYCGCLVLWPWRHERFLWPLMPVIMVFVPAGVAVLASRLHSIRKDISICVAMCLLALCIWQATLCGNLVRVNLDFVGDRVAFHATRCPGFYFSNWRRAGTWLNANAPQFCRVLTWHASVAETSFRFQKRVQFETLSPEKIRQQIEQFSARYLVVPDAQFGDGFGWQQLASDPSITLNVVYREQDVAILEVTPNRTGEISQTAYSEWLDEQLRLVADARRRMPDRDDLAIRHASLLREAGSDEKAIQILRELFDKGIITVRVCSELGWLLYDASDFAEAARFLDLARTLPNAESIAGILSDGAAKARQRLNEPGRDVSDQSIDRQLRRVKSLMNSLKFAAAAREADSMIASHPDELEAMFVRGKVHHRLGEVQQAEQCYERALKLGFKDAQEWLLLIRLNEAVLLEGASTIKVGETVETVDPTVPAVHLRLASAFKEHGWPGRALATLEYANTRFPDQPEIQLALADLYRHFAFPELAIPLLESVLSRTPIDESANKSLVAVQRLLIEPKMKPRGVMIKISPKTNK